MQKNVLLKTSFRISFNSFSIFFSNEEEDYVENKMKIRF